MLADELAATLGADAVHVLLVDVSGRAVTRFGGSAANAARLHDHGAEHAPALRLAGTDYEQVLRSQRAVISRSGDGARLVVPVSERGDALGLIEFLLPWRPDEQLIEQLVGAGRVLAYVVIAARRHTDLFEWAQRSDRFSLAAEIQRRLLPTALTCEAGRFTVAGWLEPANAVGGDTFDYALDRGTLHVSITDAVGHDVNAATLATVLVGGLRNGRRDGLDLADQAATANAALLRHSPRGDFVTGLLMRLDLERGVLAFVNAGHPLPYRLRDGRVEELTLAVDPPFGILADPGYRVQSVPLTPGDRIVLVTDGILERGAARLDVPALLAAGAELHPRHVVFGLGEAVLRATGGDLRDDATVVCVDWTGGPSLARDDTGALRQPGSAPTG